MRAVVLGAAEGGGLGALKYPAAADAAVVQAEEGQEVGLHQGEPGHPPDSTSAGMCLGWLHTKELPGNGF
jgi:hypothetical protein